MPFGCFAFCHAFCKSWRQSSRQPPMSCQAIKNLPFRLPGSARVNKKSVQILGNPQFKFSIACQSTGCLCLGSPAGSFGLRGKALQTSWRQINLIDVCICFAPCFANVWHRIRQRLSFSHTCKIGCTRSGRKATDSRAPTQNCTRKRLARTNGRPA